jgi:hypothetical protein
MLALAGFAVSMLLVLTFFVLKWKELSRAKG